MAYGQRSEIICDQLLAYSSRLNRTKKYLIQAEESGNQFLIKNCKKRINLLEYELISLKNHITFLESELSTLKIRFDVIKK